MNETPNLGDQVRDKVTGFTGACTAIVDSLYEASRVKIEMSAQSDGTIPTQWFDATRVEVVKAAGTW
jgi:hypothetical protein